MTPHVHTIAVKGGIKPIQDFCKRYGYSLTVHKPDYKGWAEAAIQKAYEEAAFQVKGMLFFWNGETVDWSWRMLKHIQHVRKVEYKSFRQQLKEQQEKDKAERPKKRKKITVKLAPESKHRYAAANYKATLRNTPSVIKDGFYCPPVIPVINSGAAMDNFIVQFLVWEGWSATKVTVMQKVGGKFVRSGSKQGTFDLTATIKGKSVKIETKHSTDKPSEAQLKMQVRERGAGAVAEFVYSIEEFFVLYDKILNNQI